MTKLFCDRCKNEIKNRNTAHKFDFQGEWDCFKAFEAFMRMDNSMYHTRDILHNPGGDHGIERMTFGSR